MQEGGEQLVCWKVGEGNNLRGSWEAVLSREDRWGNEEAAGEGWSRGKFQILKDQMKDTVL